MQLDGTGTVERLSLSLEAKWEEPRKKKAHGIDGDELLFGQYSKIAISGSNKGVSANFCLTYCRTGEASEVYKGYP